MNILITLCARGGSKGIPGKNIKLLNGLPLIIYSIQHAKEFVFYFKNVDIELSTDNEKIKHVAERNGLKTDYVRPSSLAGDEIGKIEVISDVLNYREKLENKKYDIILDLDISSPLRNIQDLKNAYHKLIENPEAYNIFSVSRPRKNPYFNVVEQKEGDYFKLVKESEVLSRQSAPEVYDMNASFYFYQRAFFEDACKTAVTKKSLIYIMDHICFDLDEPLDFEIMEFLISQNKLDFEF